MKIRFMIISALFVLMYFSPANVSAQQRPDIGSGESKIISYSIETLPGKTPCATVEKVVIRLSRWLSRLQATKVILAFNDYDSNLIFSTSEKTITFYPDPKDRETILDLIKEIVPLQKSIGPQNKTARQRIVNGVPIRSHE